MIYDAVISFASEDRDNFVIPLIQFLERFGIKLWYDDYVLNCDRDIRNSILEGISSAEHGILVLSDHFISKEFPVYEAIQMIQKEQSRGFDVIPICHGISQKTVLKHFPSLNNHHFLETSEKDIANIGLRIIEKIRPDIFRKLRFMSMVEENGENMTVPITNLKKASVRHKTLSPSLVIRILLIHHIFYEVYQESFDECLTNFKRDAYPEIAVEDWERMAAIYLKALQNETLMNLSKNTLYSVILELTGSPENIANYSSNELTTRQNEELVALAKFVFDPLN